VQKSNISIKQLFNVLSLVVTCVLSLRRHLSTA